MLQELSDNDSIDDDIRDNITVSIIPPDPDKMTDEDDIDKNNIDDNKNVNEFAGVYEVEGVDEEIQKNTMEQQPTRKKNSSIFDPKWRKMNPSYSREIFETSKIDHTILDNMASHTVEEFFELLYSKELVEKNYSL